MCSGLSPRSGHQQGGRLPPDTFRAPLSLGRRAVLWQFGGTVNGGTIFMGQSHSDMKSRVATLETLLARTRHDVRSALAPAMLAADTLRANPDPRVQRSAATVLRAIERVLEMLDATREVVPSRQDQPPARP